MGLETPATLRLGRELFRGTAHLDSAAFSFRGETKLVVALGTVKSAEVRKKGELHVTHATGEFSLLLGGRAVAEKWALKIRYPKSLIDKLGLKPESRVAVLGVDDAEFFAQAAARLKTPLLEKLGSAAGAPFDFIFYAADSAAELEELASLKERLAPTGAIWIVSRKGKAATVKDVDVIGAGKAARLVDVKVCGFSATHTALKFVIPVAERK